MSPRRALLALVGAGIAVALSISGAGPASAAEPSPGDTVIIDCLDDKVVKPKQIVFECAGDQLLVKNIRWKSWKKDTAQGRGTLVWNTCLPTDCASGINRSYRARITLDRPASGPGVTVFSRMKLTFLPGGPASLETGTLTLPNEGI